VETCSHSKQSRAGAALVSLLVGTTLLVSSGCATAWPLAGHDAPPAEQPAATVNVTDVTARVRANAAGDLVPVDAPVTIGGTAVVKDSPVSATPRNAASEPKPIDPANRRPVGFGQALSRLEAALEKTDSPPAPPIPRMTRSVENSEAEVPGAIEPVGGGSLARPAVVPIPRIVVESTVPNELPETSETPGTLKPGLATAAVVRLPDVIDWSRDESRPAVDLPQTSVSRTPATSQVRRHVPWWLTVIGLVGMVGLIGLSRRFGWPSVSPLE